MATALMSGDCGAVSEANALFATEKGLLVLRPGHGCLKAYFTVPSGCYALVTRHGADLDYVDEKGVASAVWPAGLHYFYPPWTHVSNLVTKQSIVLDLPVKACKTKDNVTVNVDVALVFRIMGDTAFGEDPELVRKFVYEVKPRGLEQQLRDAQEEAVRALARSMTHTEVYGIRSGGKADLDDDENIKDSEEMKNEDEDDDFEPFEDDVFVGSSDKKDRKDAKKAVTRGQNVAAEMRKRLNRQFVPQGIQIQSVMIKSVQLPSDICAQMTEKTMIISANAQQRMYHEDAMQVTRMDEETQTMLQTFHEQREQETQAGLEVINSEQVKLNDAIAQASKSEANIREETRVKIENIFAESSLQVQRVKDRMAESIEKIRAESFKEAAELEAATKLEEQTKLADATLKATENQAEAASILFKAEGEIAPWLEKKKEYETKQRQMNVYNMLADNNELIISGSVDDGVNLIAAADAILADVGGDKSDHSRLMAELVLMEKASSSFLNPAKVRIHDS